MAGKAATADLYITHSHRHHHPGQLLAGSVNTAGKIEVPPGPWHGHWHRHATRARDDHAHLHNHDDFWPHDNATIEDATKSAWLLKKD